MNSEITSRQTTVARPLTILASVHDHPYNLERFSPLVGGNYADGRTQIPISNPGSPQSSPPIYATRSTQDHESVGEKLTANCSAELPNHGPRRIYNGEVAPASKSQV
jgi:hypothetical protein